VAFNTRVSELCVDAEKIGVVIDDYTLLAKLLINCSGLGAPGLFKTICPESGFTARYAKGHYYFYAGESPFSQLIYPVAEAGGLGVHVTHDLAGQARFGPDVQWVDTVDYAFVHNDQAAFVEAIKRYYPALDESRLKEGYTGIRPKILVSGNPVTDFIIEGQDKHGINGLINLFGIESPGMTASLAIAEYVVNIASRTLE
jgi:L-2-hydroxyglutarate oxidase LhgO